MISRPALSAPAMPDIAHETRAQHPAVLDWVGMDRMEMPVNLTMPDGRSVTTPARAAAFVDLVDPEERGIHMSRLYLALDTALTGHELTPALLARTLETFVERHHGISGAAMIHLDFELMVRRAALSSDESGWRTYPVSVTAVLDRGEVTVDLGATVTYSSTCPCSAALSRQLVQEKFQRDFPGDGPLDREAVLAWLGTDQGIVATPHSQRSTAQVRVRLTQGVRDFQPIELIDAVEDALQTPVQAAVKREDEQAFAHLNGQNLMFCEDAGRRVRAALDARDDVADYWVRATHEESLHPHDAVSVTTRGVPGGFAPGLSTPEGAR
jgi:GTP cyclohydrolase I